MAAVVQKAGGPEALKIEKRPIPKPEKGQVLIRIKALGLTLSVIFTRQGHFPFTFPQVLGIEATGVVEEAPGSEEKLKQGEIVGNAMGGMGPAFDGGYPEYTCVSASQVQIVKAGKSVPWKIVGSLPEMMQTVQGALFQTLHLKQNDRLLIRGGTSSIGLAAAAIAKQHGVVVAAITREPDREVLLRANVADQVSNDNRTLVGQVKQMGG